MSVREMLASDQTNQSTTNDDAYDNGYLRVEPKNYYVACGGRPLKLPRTEFLIFSRLVRSPDRVVTAQELWTAVWNSNKPLNTESLHVYIYRLRSKLTEFGLEIETMVNVGYRLVLSTEQWPAVNGEFR